MSLLTGSSTKTSASRTSAPADNAHHEAEHRHDLFRRAHQRGRADHRPHLRALFLLGQALGQRCEYEAASEHHRRALTGQETSLGRSHPETPHTRYELSVEQLTLGDRQAGRDAMHAVLRDVGWEVGSRNDLHRQARVVPALSTFLPGAAWRTVSRLDDRRKR